ncbi:MAG: zf-HC2 domain-containing protein [Geothrix sp.]|uniref:anti-sigma factor family protein n=1 Tax=Geothrix sp. TaxID=1962974 RepID=UPI001828CDF7|nr:zf-HC2 domain-containing protein [Geothrix sp.]NWJ40090.1 zf-HC2 domain-containing protein [Geothrix sp.]WIL21901.1 MAG: zf-HC2 domain-containing protein [Geothrix sp.]
MDETSMQPLSPDPEAAPLDPGASPELTRAILARTSGDPCHRLQSLACDFVDGTLEAGQASLVRLHLGHCEACSALVEALTSLRTDLPAMTEVDPGPWFTQAVLRATRHQPIRRSADLRGLWWRLMHRPRISLETAYLGAAAGLMGTYLPLPALAPRVPALVQPLGDSALRVAGQVAQAERRTSASLQRSLRPIVSPRPAPRPRGSLWQRLSSWIRTRLQVFRRTPPPPPSPEAKMPPSANP